MQVHLVGPDYDQVGTPQVGFPVAVVGFNRHTGWGRTVNTIDTVDFYQAHRSERVNMSSMARCGPSSARRAR